jgi:thioredoxin 1
MNNPIIQSINEKNFYNKIQTSKKPFIVLIGANWCGNCHIIDPMLDALAIQFEEELGFTKLNIDINEDIARNYGVSELPIILFFKNGNLIDHSIGLVSKKNLSHKISQLITE